MTRAAGHDTPLLDWKPDPKGPSLRDLESKFEEIYGHPPLARDPDTLLDWTRSGVETINESRAHWTPLAREGDPVTSHLAGEHVAATSREAQCARILSAIEKTPGHIASYYSGLLGIEGGWRRVSDLVTRGQAHYSGTAVDPRSKRSCGRLWPGRLSGE